MRIGVIGAGRIGGNAARLFAKAGHEVLVSFSRDQQQARGARGRDRRARRHAARGGAFGEVVMLSVSWTLDRRRPRAGRIARRQDGHRHHQPVRTRGLGGPRGPHGRAGQRRADAGSALHEGLQHAHVRLPGEAAGRTGPDRVVMFLCGDDEEAKRVVAGLIDDAGFTPVDMGGIADARRWRRPGATAPCTARRSTSSRRAPSSRGCGLGMTPHALRVGRRRRGARPPHAVLLPPRPRRPDPGAGLRRRCRPSTPTTSRCGSARSSAARPSTPRSTAATRTCCPSTSGSR